MSTDNDGVSDDVELTRAIRHDFMLNRFDFEVNKYCGLNLLDANEAFDGKQYAYVSHAPKSGRIERDRRLRMLAQQAMAFRTNRVIATLMEQATVIGREKIHEIANTMPKHGRVRFVLSPETAEKVSLADAIEWQKLCCRPEICIEQSVRVSSVGKGMLAEFVCPNGTVFVVWSEEPAIRNSCGLRCDCSEKDAFLVQWNPDTEVACVVDRFNISADGHCYQFRI